MSNLHNSTIKSRATLYYDQIQVTPSKPERFTMKSSSQAVPLMAILMLVLLVSPSSVAAVTCGDAFRYVSPCVNYLRSGSGMPPPPCCAGAKALAAACPTTTDRQTACGCLKTASQSLNVNPALAKALPGNCQINLGFTVGPNIDCSTYVFQLAISLKLFFTSTHEHAYV